MQKGYDDMKKKYTLIAVLSAIFALASAAAAIVVFLKMKNKKSDSQPVAADADFDDYDIDFLLDSDDETDAMTDIDLEDIAEYAEAEEDA